MNRLLLGLALLTAACGGHKSFDSLCADQVPPPAACNTACDPSSGTGDATCPSGFHCAAAGKCDTLCTPTGNECGNGYSCTTDGFCQSAGDGDDQSPIDANCPAIHFTPMKTTPTVQLLLDQSGSMTSNYGNNGTSKPDRWDALRTALVDPTAGVVATLGDKVVFGATLYSAHSTDQPNVCPILTKTTDRKLNNFTEIQQLVNSNNPLNDTPTAASIDAVRMDFAANPPAQGSPPIIVMFPIRRTRPSRTPRMRSRSRRPRTPTRPASSCSSCLSVMLAKPARTHSRWPTRVQAWIRLQAPLCSTPRRIPRS
jgi:hypothetical protein